MRRNEKNLGQTELKMVVFDFDGVIADSEKAHFQMFSEVLLEEGTQLNWTEYCDKYLGYTDLECFERVLIDKGGKPAPDLINQLFHRKKTKFARYIQQNSLIMPGVRELLNDLADNNITCSICSGALREEVQFILDKENLSPFFAFIIAAGDVSRGKPDPQGYLLCLERFNAISAQNPPFCANNQLTTAEDPPCSAGKQPIAAEDQPCCAHNPNLPTSPSSHCPENGAKPGLAQPSECVVIEDSIWGIQAAQAAKMRCLAVATSYPAEQLQVADMVVSDLTCIKASSLRKMLI